ncbi:MAG TPA: class I SAM-dependent methyltransferase, partial [Actinobacteria bacterium]|nr:class I SAM-dependent methyltransferase [Actinomycetota bacterium]
MDSKEATKAIIDMLSDRSEKPPAFRLWDGERIGPADAPVTIVLQHPGALRSLLIPPSDLTAGEAYVYDDVDVEGDIFSLLDFGFEFVEGSLDKRTALSLLRLARRLPRQNRRRKADRPRKQGRLHSIRRDRQDVRYHYDVGNDFYRQFLDPLMVYSSAAFLDPSESLEVAQRRKLDMICHKLQLCSG